MEKKTFAVIGMKCPHCKANVESTILALEGVSKAVANLEDANVTIEYDESVVSPTDIKEVVDNCGRYEFLLE
ncbi:MAG: heavy-metal-associated domain-containing protein [Bacteroidaceae bacterium]|nr:heavy-metal-associated domain-containing protein [Bacteroidaceae bacterium]